MGSHAESMLRAMHSEHPSCLAVHTNMDPASLQYVEARGEDASRSSTRSILSAYLHVNTRTVVRVLRVMVASAVRVNDSA